MDAAQTPAPPESEKKPRFLRAIAVALAIVVVAITAGTLVALAVFSFERAASSPTGLALLAATARGMITLPTFLCVGLLTALGVFFRWIRQPHE